MPMTPIRSYKAHLRSMGRGQGRINTKIPAASKCLTFCFIDSVGSWRAGAISTVSDSERRNFSCIFQCQTRGTNKLIQIKDYFKFANDRRKHRKKNLMQLRSLPVCIAGPRELGSCCEDRVGLYSSLGCNMDCSCNSAVQWYQWYRMSGAFIGELSIPNNPTSQVFSEGSHTITPCPAASHEKQQIPTTSLLIRKPTCCSLNGKNCSASLSSEILAGSSETAMPWSPLVSRCPPTSFIRIWTATTKEALDFNWKETCMD